MSLIDENFLFLDCQTTGMRPPSGKLLEIAWAVSTASDLEPLSTEKHIVGSADTALPKRIQKITGITENDLHNAISDELIFQRLSQVSKECPVSAVIIHYAPFEVAFLKDLFLRYSQTTDLPFQILCTAQIARRLFPALPSTNIRAVAGFFGASVGELKRSGSHVEATHNI